MISIVAMRVARRRGARLINWLQDVYPEIAVELGVPFLKGPLSALIASLRDRSLKAAAANVVVGQRMAVNSPAEGSRRPASASLPIGSRMRRSGATSADFIYADAMTDSRAALINRLSEARVRLARQIDMLASLTPDYRINRETQLGDLIKQLQDTLSQVEECIAAVWHEKSE